MFQKTYIACQLRNELQMQTDFPVGFIPLEHKKSEAIINNYYIKENNAEVLKALLEKVIDSTDEDKQLSSVTFIEHQKIFQELGFSVEKEWKRYVKMNKEK